MKNIKASKGYKKNQDMILLLASILAPHDTLKKHILICVLSIVYYNVITTTQEKNIVIAN
jgi:hypothetical protein